MPHSTYKYHFEGLMVAWAGAFAISLTGRPARFLIVLTPNGVAQQVLFDPTDPFVLLKELERAETPHLFFDPFDAPEYTYISWSRIRRETMARLIGQPLDLTSLESVAGNEQMAAFPETWSVMF